MACQPLGEYLTAPCLRSHDQHCLMAVQCSQAPTHLVIAPPDVACPGVEADGSQGLRLADGLVDVGARQVGAQTPGSPPHLTGDDRLTKRT